MEGGHFGKVAREDDRKWARNEVEKNASLLSFLTGHLVFSLQAHEKRDETAVNKASYMAFGSSPP